MSKQRYIGITIGPIVKTLMLTTTPAGLWGASYIFSYFTKILIEQMKENLKIQDTSFLVPDNSKEVEKIIKDCKWAGLFHDRIIFEVNHEDITLGKVNDCVTAAKEILANGMIESSLMERGEDLKQKGIKYIKDYLQIQAIEKEIEEGKNPILELSPPLDVLELGQGYIPQESKNYILDFLENRGSLEEKKAEDRNQNIKNFTKELQEDSKKWHFLDGEKIITIDDIAGVNQEKKDSNTQTASYFALVKADGDNLGKVLKDMKVQKLKEEIKAFSKSCFSYAKEAFIVVENYGGKMIYAGGDDLLFIAPVRSKEETIFRLMGKLNDLFIKEFQSFSFKDMEGREKKMGFSAGVMLCYYKYPLNEALQGVLNQLERAKEAPTKNTISVHFEKHSGKQRGIQFENFYRENQYSQVYKLFLELLEEYLKREEESKIFLRSVGRKMKDYERIFILAMMKEDEKDFIYLREVVKNLFEEYRGIFDENEEKSQRDTEADYIEKIVLILEEIYKAKISISKSRVEEKEKAAIDSLQEVETIIGLLSFYNEKEAS